MRKTLVFFVLGLLIWSCKTQKNVFRKKSNSDNSKIVKQAEKYIGWPYKYGGLDKNGVDCSGLVWNVFHDFKVAMPRISADQARVFEAINMTDIKIGDLVFFGSPKVNHTGIVSKIVSKTDIKFIHASTSKGVVEDNLSSNYWKPRIVKITRPNLLNYKKILKFAIITGD